MSTDCFNTQPEDSCRFLEIGIARINCRFVELWFVLNPVIENGPADPFPVQPGSVSKPRKPWSSRFVAHVVDIAGAMLREWSIGTQHSAQIDLRDPKSDGDWGERGSQVLDALRNADIREDKCWVKQRHANLALKSPLGRNDSSTLVVGIEQSLQCVFERLVSVIDLLHQRDQAQGSTKLGKGFSKRTDSR